MAATRVSEREFRRQVTEARRRGRAEMARELQAKSVRYDRNTRRIVVDLKNGSTFIFPPRLVEGLADASPEDIAEVELGPRGAALFWRKLDQHYSLAGLTAGVFGSKAWMVEHLRKAGSVTSSAKAAAARANGAKGGRPRKRETA
jgi:hypothetical protein